MKDQLLAQIVENGGETPEIVGEMAASGDEQQFITVWELVQQGGWYIMIPLGILLLSAIYIWIEKFLAIRKAQRKGRDFLPRVMDKVQAGNLGEAKILCEQNPSSSARLLHKGISRIGRPMGDIGASIENQGKIEIFHLEKNLSILGTIAGAAPMIGFLGTVIGMMTTFNEMSYNGVDIQNLSGGMMQAMVTTVGGLVVGIMAYVGYNMLVAKIEKAIHTMEATTIEFLDLLQEPGN